MNTFIKILLLSHFLGVVNCQDAPTNVLDKMILSKLKLTNVTNDENFLSNFTADDSTTFNCVDPNVNCAGHGVCISNGTHAYACKCDSNYVSFECASDVQCCYKQESRVKLFLLSFFVAWTGAPYFVLGSTGMGVAMLLLWVCGCCAGVLAKTSGGENQSSLSSVVIAVGCLTYLAVVGWCLALLIMFAAETETVKDSNGVSVGPW
jgi:hypothetical protein